VKKELAMSAQAQELKSWRERLYGARGQSKAARALGLSLNAYRSYESGKRATPLHVALAAAAIAHGLPAIGAPPHLVFQEQPIAKLML
jgi:transcriptional regulator with XRE-family HTH domain